MATPSLLSKVIKSQWQDVDGSLQYRGWVVVPQSTDLREEILREFHCSRFAVHLGGTKMYQDLRL